MMCGLRELGHKVIFVGRVNGTLPKGITHIEPDITGVNHLMTGKEQRTWLDGIRSQVEVHNPDIAVTMGGLAQSCFTIFNERCVTPQAASIRYMAPSLYSIGMLGLRRVLINMDPRTYPQEQEMVTAWENLAPAYMLGSQNKEWDKVVCGRPFRLKEIWSPIQTWAYREKVDVLFDRHIRCMWFGHAHVEDGFRLKKRGPHIESCMHWCEVVYGRGMDVYKQSAVEATPRECDEALAQSKFCVIVNTWSQDFSTRVRAALIQGCCPILWSTPPFAVDVEREHFPTLPRIGLFADPEHWHFIFNMAEDERRYRVEQALQKPDFTMLDRCIHSQPNWDEWGGYKKMSNKRSA